jgi:hypothetical protein
VLLLGSRKVATPRCNRCWGLELRVGAGDGGDVGEVVFAAVGAAELVGFADGIAAHVAGGPDDGIRFVVGVVEVEFVIIVARVGIVVVIIVVGCGVDVVVGIVGDGVDGVVLSGDEDVRASAKETDGFLEGFVVVLIEVVVVGADEMVEAAYSGFNFVDSGVDMVADNVVGVDLVHCVLLGRGVTWGQHSC